MKWNADLYTNKHAFVFDYGESLIDLLSPQSHERILDLGCGTGELTQQIGEACKEVVGIDKSADMVREAQSSFPGIKFQVGDATDFQFDDKFDAIFSNATLHWVTDYRAAIQCMYDNLVPGGRMVVEFGGKGNVQMIVSELKTALAKRGYTKAAAMEPWYFPSIGNYSSELERFGFHVSYAKHYDRPTKLADKDTGIVDWIMMFGSVFFSEVHDRDIQDIASEVQASLVSELFQDGQWFADYKRIRVVARKV